MSRPKIAWTKHWGVLCIDLVGLYVPEEKYISEVDFMCLTMMDPAMNWFELVDLPAVEIPGKNRPNQKSQQTILTKLLANCDIGQ